jgi:hypothetical protein
VPDSIGRRRHGDPAQRGAIIGVAFFASFLAKQKRGRPPGRIPGLVMMQGHACWVTRRKGVTAKQQLLLK